MKQITEEKELIGKTITKVISKDCWLCIHFGNEFVIYHEEYDDMIIVVSDVLNNFGLITIYEWDLISIKEFEDKRRLEKASYNEKKKQEDRLKYEELKKQFEK